MAPLQFRLMHAAAVCITALNVQCSNCGRENICHNWTGEWPREYLPQLDRRMAERIFATTGQEKC